MEIFSLFTDEKIPSINWHKDRISDRVRWRIHSFYSSSIVGREQFLDFWRGGGSVNRCRVTNIVNLCVLHKTRWRSEFGLNLHFGGWANKVWEDKTCSKKLALRLSSVSQPSIPSRMYSTLYLAIRSILSRIILPCVVDPSDEHTAICLSTILFKAVVVSDSQQARPFWFGWTKSTLH